MSAVRLSILIPAHNNAHSIGRVLDQVIQVSAEYVRTAKITQEIVVVDDASQDSTSLQVENFARLHPSVSVRLLRHLARSGRGGAIRTAIAYAAGDFCLLNSASSAPQSECFQAMLDPLLASHADMVSGSRILCTGHRQPMRLLDRLNAGIIGICVGALSGRYLSDVMCSGKAFRSSLLKTLPLKSRGAGIDAEVVVQASRRHARFIEVPVRTVGTEQEPTGLWRTCGVLLRAFTAKFLNAAHTEPASDMLVAVSHANRFNSWMADVIKPWINGNVLEFGAGIGNMTLPLSLNAEHYCATDTDPGHLSELRSRTVHLPQVSVGLCDFSQSQDIALYCQSADTIVCLNVLEHIADDVAALANIRSCLKEGGVAVILVPQGPGAFGSLDEVLEHKRRYTRVELHHKMALAGFQVNEIIEFNRATWPGWYLNSRLLRRRGLSRLQLQLFDLFVPLLKKIDRFLPWPATSFIAIGSVEPAS